MLTSAKSYARKRETDKEGEGRKRKQEARKNQKKKEKEKLAKKKVEGKTRKVSHQKKQPNCKRSVTLEATKSSPALRNSTTQEETVISDGPVIPTAEHDVIQAAAISEPQDQEYESCEYYGIFEKDIALGNQAEWAMCACGNCGCMKDCVSETVLDANGKLRMCSDCVV